MRVEPAQGLARPRPTPPARGSHRFVLKRTLFSHGSNCGVMLNKFEKGVRFRRASRCPGAARRFHEPAPPSERRRILNSSEHRKDVGVLLQRLFSFEVGHWVPQHVPIRRPFDGSRNPFRIMLQLRRPGRLRVLILQSDGDGCPPPNGRRCSHCRPSAGGPEPQQSIAGHGLFFASFLPGRDRSFRRPLMPSLATFFSVSEMSFSLISLVEGLTTWSCCCFNLC